MHCAARTNLTMSEETVMRLIVELTERLNSLVEYLSTAVSILNLSTWTIREGLLNCCLFFEQ